MLGAVKGDGTAEGVPLFRILALRWKSLAPVKPKRVRLVSMMPADQEAEPARKWISKPRDVYAHQAIDAPKTKRAWNPWLWIK